MLTKSENQAMDSPTAGQDERVELRDGRTLRLHAPALLSQPDADNCREFLGRLFSVAQVIGVDISGRSGTADIRCRTDSRVEQVACDLAQSLSASAANVDRGAVDRLWLKCKPGTAVRVFRYGKTLTTWQIAHESNGRLRLRHDLLLRDRNAAWYVEQELASTHGVVAAKGRAMTGTMLVCFDAAQVARDALLRIVERLLHEYHAWRTLGDAPPASNGAATGSLALAATADFLVPAMAPASAALLVYMNRRNIQSAALDVARRRASLQVLYTVIVAGTVANGAFFAAAAMGWFMTFWNRQYHRRVALAQRQMLGRFIRRVADVRICCRDEEIRASSDDVRRGQMVWLEAGELAVVDGIVISGKALVDERLVQGSSKLAAKVRGDWVYASSRLVKGKLEVRATRTGDGTRAASLAAILRQAAMPPTAPLHLCDEPLARRAVVPTLAAAGAGLAVGDLNTALAVLRPDYATGPGMAAPLGSLEDLHAALKAGIVVRDPAMFDRAREVELVLLDVDDELAAKADTPESDSAADGPQAPPYWTNQVRTCRNAQLGLICPSSGRRLQSLSRRLGADFSYGTLTPADKAELVRRWTAAGSRVAYIGDCEANASAAEAAHLAISTVDFAAGQQGPAAAFLMQPDWDRVGKLWEIAMARERRNQITYRCAVGPNLACVAGAFLFDLSILATVLISNAGVLAAYRHVSRWLHKSERSVRRSSSSGRSRGRHSDPIRTEPTAGRRCAAPAGPASHPQAASGLVGTETPKISERR